MNKYTVLAVSCETRINSKRGRELWGSAYLEVASAPNNDVTRTYEQNRRRRVAILRVPYLERLPRQNGLFRRELGESQQKMARNQP